MEPSTPAPGSSAGLASLPGAPADGGGSGDHAPSSRTSTHLTRGLARLARLAEQFGDDALAGEVRDALEPLRQNLLRMVALGQFKRGKSTLLNSLLGADILPSGAAPVTSVSTVVRWAPDASLEVFFESGEVENTDIGRLGDFVVEARNPGNALGVRRVEVGYPSSLLEDGLVLVDTPGIGSTDLRATERAYGFLPSVDAGMVVLSPDPPVGEAEAAYIRELASLTPHLLFVLNKIDRVSEAEWREVQAFNRQVLADVLQRAPEDIDIIPVSAKRALQEDEASVMPLRERIEAFIAHKGAHVREDLGSRRMRASVAKLRARLNVERRAMDMEVQELDGRIEGLRQTLGSLDARATRGTRTMMTAVDDIVSRSGDAMLAHARSQSGELTKVLRDTVRGAPASMGNSALATLFDQALADETWAILDAWWAEKGPGIVGSLLEEMHRASDDLFQARHEASDWIREAFGVELPDEPRVEALKEGGSFYRRVEGVTPRLTVDLLRALLPRGMYRGWIRRSVPKLAARALDMGAGQVRGDLLYRVRETARGFAAEVRAWTLAGTEGLMEGVSRAAALRTETRSAAEDRRQELDAGLRELEALERAAG